MCLVPPPGSRATIPSGVTSASSFSERSLQVPSARWRASTNQSGRKMIESNASTTIKRRIQRPLLMHLLYAIRRRDASSCCTIGACCPQAHSGVRRRSLKTDNSGAASPWKPPPFTRMTGTRLVLLAVAAHQKAAEAQQSQGRRGRFGNIGRRRGRNDHLTNRIPKVDPYAKHVVI